MHGASCFPPANELQVSPLLSVPYNLFPSPLLTGGATPVGDGAFVWETGAVTFVFERGTVIFGGTATASTGTTNTLPPLSSSFTRRVASLPKSAASALFDGRTPTLLVLCDSGVPSAGDFGCAADIGVPPATSNFLAPPGMFVVAVGSASPTPTRTSSPTGTATGTGTQTPSISLTGTMTATPSVTRSIPRSNSPAPTLSSTPTASLSFGASPSSSGTGTSSVTTTPSPVSATPSPSVTPSNSRTPSNTPSKTSTAVSTPSSTWTATPTGSVAPSMFPTATPSRSVSATFSVAPSSGLEDVAALAAAGSDSRTNCSSNLTAVAVSQRYAVALQFTVRLPVDLTGSDVSPWSPADVAALALAQTAPAAWLCALYGLGGMYAARSAVEAGAVLAAVNASAAGDAAGSTMRGPPPSVESLPAAPPSLLRMPVPAATLVVSTARPDGSQAVLWSPRLDQLAPACAPANPRVALHNAGVDADIVRASVAGGVGPGAAHRRYGEERKRSQVQAALFGNATDGVAAAAAAAAGASFDGPGSSASRLPMPSTTSAASATATPLQPLAATIWGWDASLPGRLLFTVASPNDAGALRVPTEPFTLGSPQLQFPIMPASDNEYAFAVLDATSPTDVRPLNSTVLAVHVLIDANMTVGDACAARAASSLLARRLGSPLDQLQALRLLETGTQRSTAGSVAAAGGSVGSASKRHLTAAAGAAAVGARPRVLAGLAPASRDIPAWPLVLLQRAASMCADEDAANAGLVPDPTSILGCQSASLLVMDALTSSTFGFGEGLPVSPAALVATGSETPAPAPAASPSSNGTIPIPDGSGGSDGSSIVPIAGGAAAGGVIVLLLAVLAGRYFCVFASRRRAMLQAAAVSLVRVGMAEKALQLTVAGAVASSATGIIDMLAAEAVAEQLDGVGLAPPKQHQQHQPHLQGGGKRGAARQSRVSFAPAVLSHGQGDSSQKQRASAVASSIAASFAAAAEDGNAPKTPQSSAASAGVSGSAASAAAALASPSDSAELRKLRGAAMAAVGRALPASAIAAAADAALAAARNAVSREPTVAHAINAAPGASRAGAGGSPPLLSPADAFRSMVAAAVDSAESALDALERSGELVSLTAAVSPAGGDLHSAASPDAARAGARRASAAPLAAGGFGAGPAISRRAASASVSGASHVVDGSHGDEDNDDACDAFVDVWFADMMLAEAALPTAAAAVPLKEQAQAVAANAGLRPLRPLRKTGGLKQASDAGAATSASEKAFDVAGGPGAVARLRAAIEMRLRASQAAKAAVARGDADALRSHHTRRGSHSSAATDEDGDEGAVVIVTEGNADEVLAEHAAASPGPGKRPSVVVPGSGSPARLNSATRTRAPAAQRGSVSAVNINASAALQVARVGTSSAGRRAGGAIIDIDVGSDFSAARAARRRQLQALVICTLSAQARATAQQLAQSLRPGDEQAAAVLAEAQ